MSEAAVLDASALLCLLQGEAGSERVLQALPAAVIGTANLAEVVSKLCEHGLTAKEVEDVLGCLPLDVRPLIASQAYAIGHLRPTTRDFLGCRSEIGPVLPWQPNSACLP